MRNGNYCCNHWKRWTVAGIIFGSLFIFLFWAVGSGTSTCDYDCYDAEGLDCSNGCYDCKGDMSDYCIADCGFWEITDCNKCECGSISPGAIAVIVICIVLSIACCVFYCMWKRRPGGEYTGLLATGTTVTTPINQKQPAKPGNDIHLYFNVHEYMYVNIIICSDATNKMYLWISHD